MEVDNRLRKTRLHALPSLRTILICCTSCNHQLPDIPWTVNNKNCLQYNPQGTWIGLNHNKALGERNTCVTHSKIRGGFPLSFRLLPVPHWYYGACNNEKTITRNILTLVDPVLDSGSAHLVLSQQASRRLLVASATPASSQTYPACETNVITDCSKEGGGSARVYYKEGEWEGKESSSCLSTFPISNPRAGNLLEKPIPL